MTIHQIILQKAAKLIGYEIAAAHCDIPCGIYDPHYAQIAALTTVRMIDMMNEQKQNHHNVDLEMTNSIGRHIIAKEEHAEICKREVRVIWGDYFKTEHFEKYPQLHEITNKIMKSGSKVRQGVNREDATALVELVNEFSQIFWETKGIKTKRAKSPYKPELELVYPVL